TRDLGALSGRLLSVGSRLQTLLPEPADGRRLSARARIIAAMRGDGSASFPQEARVVLGPRERTVRIGGKLGALQLTVETAVGGTRDLQARRAAIPLLPVPGSLRVSPDGKFVAWIEVVGPAMLVPVMTSLERDEPAREIAFLSGGRPLRDQALAHVVTSLSGFSKDGQRLGFAIEAWNDAPGPEPRRAPSGARRKRGRPTPRRSRREGAAPATSPGSRGSYGTRPEEGGCREGRTSQRR